MPYIWTEPDLFVEHNDVEVYHTYRNDRYDDGVKEFWYTTNLLSTDNDFDIRDLENYDTTKSHKEILIEAIEKGFITKEEI